MSRRSESHPSFLEELPPVREGSPIFCHQVFLEKMEENRGSTVGRRASLLLQRLLVDVRRPLYKPTQGENRGWRRSPLGGNHGNHFYAWWAPKGAPPLKANPDFESTPEGSVFLRDIRHHDDHSPLTPQSLNDHYLAVGVKDLRSEDYVPAPWTQAQARFADARQNFRIIKGFPGSGKTTALWHAADMAGRQSILYITYSPDLAALARDHFDKFAPGQKRFHVVTYAQFLREVLESDTGFEPLRQARTAFVKEISGFSPTILGPWLNERPGLYDEIHAHLFGGMLPFAVARFAGFPERKMSARQYREVREHKIGRAGAEAVIEVCETLRRRDSRPVEQRFFGELDTAWRAVERIQHSGAGKFAAFDCVAIDEVQDLTPLEALVVIELTRRIGGRVNLLIAGDEAQTVRPTDFEWGWLQDLLHHRLGTPAQYNLQTNLRSPKRIAVLVNRVWDLYSVLAKHERPSGSGVAEIDENAGDQVILCSATSGPELEELLDAFCAREGLAVIAMGEEIPAYVPERLRDRVLTTFEAKGLDFHSVCLLEAGSWLDRILKLRDRGRGLELDDLSRRLGIDQLRVALSRPAERLYWLDVNANERILDHSSNFLSFNGERAYAMVPSVTLKNLEEETLDTEERVRLCESDARQFLEVKQVLAWSRARQAVALLGESGSRFSVADETVRRSAQMTLCQVAFTLAFRKLRLPPEIGRLDLYGEAIRAAAQAGRRELSELLHDIKEHEQDYGTDRLRTLLVLATAFGRYRDQVDSWLLQELQPRSTSWIRAIEERTEQTPEMVVNILPPMYELFLPLESKERTARLQEKTVDYLIRIGAFGPALRHIEKTPNPDPKLVAQCREGMGELEVAAAEYLRAGSPQDALRCYRSIPDFDKSLELLAQIGDHPAKESLEWVLRMRELAGARPVNFTKVMVPAEKKLLEQILETSLGASRKKPAAKKAATKKPPAKKAAPRKRPVPPGEAF
jgi:hypothetical protein